MTFGISGPAYVHHMNQSIRMAEIIQEFISQTTTLMRPRNKTSNIQKFYRNGATTIVTTSIIRFTPIRDVESLACAFYLQIANGSLGVDSSETGVRGLDVTGRR